MKKSLFKVSMYLIMGGLTTIVNILSYWISEEQLGLNYKASTAIAWLTAVAFAYVTNKRYVFESNTTTVGALLMEVFSFISFRFLSFLMDLGVMILLVDGLNISGSMAKIWSNVVVLIANYTFSRKFIFKQTKVKEEGMVGKTN